ncbi:MAG: hypothetical protein IJ198_13800 [Lachnospiraceae bacterium]|nr:hypothetical protein [Lachnospiraceae bacterium]
MMFLKMDERIEKALDEMMVQKLKGSPEIFSGNTLTIGKSWISELSQVSQEYSRISDSDALEILPELTAVFERKMDQARKMSIPEDVREQILFEISVRKHLIVDARIREINKGSISSGNSDVW